jgi:hypothetical protein
MSCLSHIISPTLFSGTALSVSVHRHSNQHSLPPSGPEAVCAALLVQMQIQIFCWRFMLKMYMLYLLVT